MKNNKIKHGVLLLTIVVGVLFLLIFVEGSEVRPPSEEEKNEKFEYLLAHRLTSPLQSNLYPVFIFRDPVVTADKIQGTWRASGTALIKDGQPKWVLSAAHCFNTNGTYYVTIVLPNMTKSIWGIESLSGYDGTNDVVCAKIGNPRSVEGIVTNIKRLDYNKKVSIFTYPRERYVQSQITGKQYKILGSLSAPGEPSLYLLDYSCTQAESGSGFLSEGAVMVVNQFAVLDTADQRRLGIEPRNGYFTLLTETWIK